MIARLARLGVLATLLCGGAQAAFAATTPQVEVPLPPTPAGAAPGSVLTTPIAPVSGPAQTIHPGTDVEAQWWHRFGSKAMDDLVTRALAANTDIAQAEAALRQSRDLAGAARGVLFPQIDAGYSYERQRLSRNLSTPLADPNPQVFSIHTAQVSVSYTLDLFGLNRANLRSAQAAARAAEAKAQAMRVMVVGNVLLGVIQNAGLEAQAEAARASIAENREVLDLLRRRQAYGAVGKADVAAQEAALAAAEGALPPIEKARADNLAALAVLIGVAPGSPLPELPALDSIALPADLPLTLPAELVRQRPDVAAAAGALDVAAANVRAAIAARLPQITLSASAGGNATDFAQMFANGNPFWAAIGAISTPIFHGGTLLKQQRAARDALEGAKAAYKGTALQAFADVSNALTALSTDAEALDAAKRGHDAANVSLEFTRKQLELGSVGTFAVLNATAAADQARVQYVQARSQRLSDTVGLFTALGGGQLTAPAPAR